MGKQNLCLCCHGTFRLVFSFRFNLDLASLTCSFLTLGTLSFLLTLPCPLRVLVVLLPIRLPTQFDHPSLVVPHFTKDTIHGAYGQAHWIPVRSSANHPDAVSHRTWHKDVEFLPVQGDLPHSPLRA